MDKKKGVKSKDKKNKPKPVLVPEEEVDENSEEPLEVRFEREVAWCKAEIFQRLHHVKLDSKQGFDLARALKILDSDKAPMIKKRQAMRTTLGDYRKKMKEEEKKQAAAAKKITLKPADESQTKLSKCFKVSTSQQKQKTEDDSSSDPVDHELASLSLAEGVSQSENDSEVAKGLDLNSDKSDSFTFVKTDNPFRFNFNSPEKVINSNPDSKEGVKGT